MRCLCIRDILLSKDYVSNRMKRKASPQKSAQRKKVKRSSSHPKKIHKRKLPPGTPISSRKKRRRAARDIFSS